MLNPHEKTVESSATTTVCDAPHATCTGRRRRRQRSRCDDKPRLCFGADRSVAAEEAADRPESRAGARLTATGCGGRVRSSAQCEACRRAGARGAIGGRSASAHKRRTRRAKQYDAGGSPRNCECHGYDVASYHDAEKEAHRWASPPILLPYSQGTLH